MNMLTRQVAVNILKNYIQAFLLCRLIVNVKVFIEFAEIPNSFNLFLSFFFYNFSFCDQITNIPFIQFRVVTPVGVPIGAGGTVCPDE